MADKLYPYIVTVDFHVMAQTGQAARNLITGDMAVVTSKYAKAEHAGEVRNVALDAPDDGPEYCECTCPNDDGSGTCMMCGGVCGEEPFDPVRDGWVGRDGRP